MPILLQVGGEVLLLCWNQAITYNQQMVQYQVGETRLILKGEAVAIMHGKMVVTVMQISFLPFPFPMSSDAMKTCVYIDGCVALNISRYDCLYPDLKLCHIKIHFFMILTYITRAIVMQHI